MLLFYLKGEGLRTKGVKGLSPSHIARCSKLRHSLRPSRKYSYIKLCVVYVWGILPEAATDHGV